MWQRLYSCHTKTKDSEKKRERNQIAQTNKNKTNMLTHMIPGTAVTSECLSYTTITHMIPGTAVTSECLPYTTMANIYARKT